MQVKTVRKNIEAKLESWLQTIKDTHLQKRVKETLLVSGGSIASMLLNEEVNDYDIYIQDRCVLASLTKYYCKGISGVTVWDGHWKFQLVEEYNKKGDLEKDNNYYASTLRNLGRDQVKIFVEGGGRGLETAIAPDGGTPEPYRVAFLSPNAISLTDNIQIVVRFHGTPEQIHKTFDFMHATNYFTFSEGLVTNKAALESLLNKQLAYQGSLYPLTSVVRAKKFLKRGWSINAGEYLKMMFQISLLDLTDIDVLEEQLIGVDVAYFSTLITALREHLTRHPEFKIDENYFNKLIDIIFNE